MASRIIDNPAKMCDFVPVLKTLLSFLLSLFIHVILGIAFWTAGSNEFSSDPEHIVDLTLTSPNQGPQLQSQSLKPPKPLKRPSLTTAAVKSPLSTEPITSAPQGQAEGIPSQADSDVSPSSWGEVTRFPKVVKEYKAKYPEEAKKAGIDGPVVLDVLIDAKGKVRTVTIIKGPGYGLNESAIEALKQFEFFPAKKGEDFVAVKIRYTYRFKLGVN